MTEGGSLKPAIKQTSASTRPDAELYQHNDPLLRRLRLYDGHGKPASLKREFRDAKVVGFYFGSQLAGKVAKEYQKVIVNLCRHYPHEFKAIYVSVDLDKKYYDAATRNEPFLSMAWHDGSSEDEEPRDKDKADNKDTNAQQDNGAAQESFLLAGDDDLEESVSLEDTSGTCYVRPYSRVYVADKLGVLMAPTLAIYHTGKREVLDKNVPLRTLQNGRDADTMERWLRGERTPRFSVIDMVQTAPWTVAMAVVAILYAVLVRLGGPEFDLISKLSKAIAEHTGASREPRLVPE